VILGCIKQTELNELLKPWSHHVSRYSVFYLSLDYLGVDAAVFLSRSVAAEGVVVEARVLHQRDPLLPARGHVGAVVLVQIFTKEG